MVFKRNQIKAARLLLGWSQEACARHSGIRLDILKRLERGSGMPPTRGILNVVSSALQNAGVRQDEQGLPMFDYTAVRK
jgi:transcriptional regulator with XRE-family HTH domain